MSINNPNQDKKFIIAGIFSSLIIIYIIRLLIVQIADDKYQLSAENNSQLHIIQYPTRGLIYDRNKNLIVSNQATYDLMIVPRETETFDTLLFCKLLNLNIKLVRKKIKDAKKYSSYKPSIFLKQISAKTYATFQEYLYLFPGFLVQSRTLRNYEKPIGAHLLGNIGEVSDKIIKNDNYYKIGDYIGISGIEKQYEKTLRGTKGKKILLVDVHNRIKGKYKNGKYDVIATKGKNITTTIDIDLQEYGEKLMANKSGSIVAIEPQSGEILAIISAPNYDPNVLVGRKRSSNYQKLLNNKSKPLFNRALSAEYPPGSIFKIINGLIGLDGEFSKANTGFVCDKSMIGCHNHPQNKSIIDAIQFSCNPYFYQQYKRIIEQNTDKNRFIDSRFGLNYWNTKVESFGMGKRLNIDLPNVKSGFIPDTSFYDRLYGKKKWAFSNIASLSIGQGEIMTVPIQMANLATIIANSGYYKTPHIIKKIDNKPYLEFKQKHHVLIDSICFAPIQEGMYRAVNLPHGTANRAIIDNIDVCGKTGTAQNPHGEDHSIFIAYAPKRNPKIAIAVYVENSGFGGTWAAPIASLMIEKYINGVISNKNIKEKEQRILDYKPLKIEKKQ